ncbi:UvrD-helicase domain-containing protein [Mangrovibacterium diazotrophicum]|uniref:DNA 3'-5' helicase n=1 Tax=Mangrovibacterium diazotrophicum TaxID=1261403 RepID=A0A419W314_9BACT|nr:UvrD-helicase domain-containing protein [Mangrovibacterium diazotrophicum]RKD89871.1 ATP-dependent exoDNAse (exonuclease V) beta subunit [Mangrovibacterium diazotrophicum]
MSQLQIYKASAGSGKTFRLAVEYLKIALSGDWNYKNILAVTFTNKATTEMKERVIEELYKLGKGEQSAYLDVLQNEMGLAAPEIVVRAQNALKHLLHDYSRFSISTIDSFFQRVIKAFNRELGINTAYQVDLEDDRILDEAVDQLLLSIDDDPDLLSWLKQFAEDKIREGGGWSLKGDILSLGRQIYNETFRQLSPVLNEKLSDKKFIRRYRKELRQIIVNFGDTLKALGEQGVEIMRQGGVSVDDFKYKKSGAASAFDKMTRNEFEPGKRVLDVVEDVAALHDKKASAHVINIAHQLQPLLAEAVTFHTENISNYNTAGLIVDQLYTLGILVDLQETVRKLTREKGVILISESGNLLKQIIDESDTPFIYEKTGVYYKHFMIDEFQDTSGLQWGNFRPLVGNSLAENNLGMLVGDVKQAIYRWRNGDWNLLATEVGQAFPANGAEEKALTQNWRSSGTVIRFNNRVFQVVPQLMQTHFSGQVQEAGIPDDLFGDAILKIYQEGLQEIGREKTIDAGYIHMRFLEKKKSGEEPTNEEQVLEELVEAIKAAQDRGVVARDMAILVRTKAEAKVIADCLLTEKATGEGHYNFNVLSGESLYVKNAASVSFLVSMLRLLKDPDDELSLSFANYQYYATIDPVLRDMNKQVDWAVEQEVAQLQMDFAPRYEPELTERFEDYRNKDNKLFEFLKSGYFNNHLAAQNLQEVIFSLSNRFCLFDFNDELAYLQAFIDHVSNYMKNRSADLAGFLDWWDEQGQRKTIAVSEELDAIRIQTIHKAKGLEYDCVFIPFCDWSLGISGQHAPMLWCRPAVAPFNQLELVPVKYGKSMGMSHFFREYFSEIRNNYIDNLNMLYVAFTRAKTALYTWSEYGKSLGTVGDLLKMCVNLEEGFSFNGREDICSPLTSHFDEEKQLLEIGALTASEAKVAKENRALTLDAFKFKDFSAYLRLRKNHENFFEPGDSYDKKINRGRLVHEVLSRIETADQLEQACDELVFKGMMNEEEADEMTEQLATLLEDPEVSSWFDGSYRVLNEHNIITGVGYMGVKRPDRIMLSHDEVIVVDYKSGEHESEKYVKQVSEYIEAIEKCGYPNVKGFIWYTRMNKRVRV